MRRSISTTSGASDPARSTARAPVSATPTTLEVLDVGQHELEPSAERRVVVGDEDADHLRDLEADVLVQRQDGAYDQAALGAAGDGARSAELGGSLGHRASSRHRGGWTARCRGRCRTP